jgi:hypothetical protein
LLDARALSELQLREVRLPSKRQDFGGQPKLLAECAELPDRLWALSFGLSLNLGNQLIEVIHVDPLFGITAYVL